MKVSIVMSIHNRGALFSKGLPTWINQTFPKSDWELLLIDDMSTQDLADHYRPHLGKFNLRHIKIDHTVHPIFKDMNPEWPRNEGKPNWYHTPALSINIGIHAARGNVICIAQPEVMQFPTNMEIGYAMAMTDKFAIVDMYCDQTGIPKNKILENPAVAAMSVPKLIELFRPNYRREPQAMFWFTAFVKKANAIKIGGVREVYLRGVAAEDDDFRERLNLIGCSPQALPKPAVGLHLYHGDETEFHHRRDTLHWQEGLKKNRRFYFEWRQLRRNQGEWRSGNEGNWARPECVVSEQEYPYKK